MSIQEFQQIPDPYSSMGKYHDPCILGNYPKEIQTICEIQGRLDFILGSSPYDKGYTMSLVLGNFNEKSYNKRFKAAVGSLLELETEYTKLKNFKYSAYNKFKQNELRREILSLFCNTILDEMKDLNAENFVFYKKLGLASFPAVLLKAKYLDLLAHRFIRCFFHYICYSPKKDILISIENAIKNGRRLILQQEDGGASVTPEFAGDVFDLRVCIEYHDARRQNDPWDTSYLRAKVPLNPAGMASMMDVQKTIEGGTYGVYGLRLMMFHFTRDLGKYRLKNILLEMELLIRSSLAVAFASVTHPRIGHGHPLSALEPDTVMRIMEFAGYYDYLI